MSACELSSLGDAGSQADQTHCQAWVTLPFHLMTRNSNCRVKGDLFSVPVQLQEASPFKSLLRPNSTYPAGCSSWLGARPWYRKKSPLLACLRLTRLLTLAQILPLRLLLQTALPWGQLPPLLVPLKLASPPIFS